MGTNMHPVQCVSMEGRRHPQWGCQGGWLGLGVVSHGSHILLPCAVQGLVMGIWGANGCAGRDFRAGFILSNGLNRKRAGEKGKKSLLEM